MKRFTAFFLAVLVVCSFLCPSAAASSISQDCPDAAQSDLNSEEHPSINSEFDDEYARIGWYPPDDVPLPSKEHNLSKSDYYATFDFESYVTTQCYFYTNDDNQIYYQIDGTCSWSKVTVETCCLDCGSKLTSYSFSPDEMPVNRVVTISSDHADHRLFFYILKGGWDWGTSHFKGNITVSHSSTV